MGNNHYEDLNFLKEEAFQKYFTSLHENLTTGKSMMKDDDFNLWELLDRRFNHLKFYYQLLYKTPLERKEQFGEVYFYLDFSQSELSQHKIKYALTQRQTFFGILFLNLFMEKQFEEQKKYTWFQLMEKIDKSEYAKGFEQLYFEQGKTATSWKEVNKNFQEIISEFEKLGFTKWLLKPKKNEENFEFKIHASIYRFFELYKNEIENIDQTINNFQHGNH